MSWNEATIQVSGNSNSNQVGLTTGQNYFVQNDGTLGLAAATPKVYAGTAVSATKLLVGKESAPEGGLTRVGGGTFSGSSSTVELFDGFISEYLAYKIIFVFSNSAGDVAAQLGSGSSAYITTGYYSQSNYAKQGGGPTVGEWQNGTRVPFHDNNKKGAGELHIFDPTSTEVGKIIHFQGLSMRNTTSFGSNLQVGFRSGVLDNATAMTKAQMISEGNFTSLRWVVYGIK